MAKKRLCTDFVGAENGRFLVKLRENVIEEICLSQLTS